MSAADKAPKQETASPALIGSSDLLAQRIGFTCYPRGSREEKRIRDAIHRARVDRPMRKSRIKLSECEAAYLYKCEPRPRYLMAKGQFAGVGTIRGECLMAMARIAQPLDAPCFRLDRTLCYAEILLLRLVRRLRSFFGFSCTNEQRSHAGPVTPQYETDAPPALVAASR